MKLSKRGEYALRALIDLGIASELGWPMLQVSELAAKEKLPIKFLEQIFAQLKAARYVKSRRGKFGGYSLARPMSQIKFGAVIRLIDGPLAPIRCVSQTSYARCSCPDEIHCGLRMLMLDVRNHTPQISAGQSRAAFPPQVDPARINLLQRGRAVDSRQAKSRGI